MFEVAGCREQAQIRQPARQIGKTGIGHAGLQGVRTDCQPHPVTSSVAAPQILAYSGEASPSLNMERHMQTSYPRQDITVLLLEGVSARAFDVFRRAGYSHVEPHPKSLPEAELRQRIGDANTDGIRSPTQLRSEERPERKK